MLMLYKQWQRNICRTSKEKRWSNTSGRRMAQKCHLIPFLSGTHCHLVGDFGLLESPSKWIKNVLKFQQQVEEGKMNCSGPGKFMAMLTYKHESFVSITGR